MGRGRNQMGWIKEVFSFFFLIAFITSSSFITRRTVGHFFLTPYLLRHAPTPLLHDQMTAEQERERENIIQAHKPGVALHTFSVCFIILIGIKNDGARSTTFPIAPFLISNLFSLVFSFPLVYFRPFLLEKATPLNFDSVLPLFKQFHYLPLSIKAKGPLQFPHLYNSTTLSLFSSWWWCFWAGHPFFFYLTSQI